MPNNNESTGIAAEVAIAKTYNVNINSDYATRADSKIVRFLLESGCIPKIFENNHIPAPMSHIAENQNPVDFVLCNGQTLSVKTNKKALNRQAPQNIGQPTSKTFFDYIESNEIVDFKITDYLKSHRLEDNYANRSKAFKYIILNHIVELIQMYWENLFDCDYWLCLYNLTTFKDPMSNHLVLRKSASSPFVNLNSFSFTQDEQSWNESNTVKYCGVSIGNFQTHNNRDCFKFRFNVNNLIKLKNQGII